MIVTLLGEAKIMGWRGARGGGGCGRERNLLTRTRLLPHWPLDLDIHMAAIGQMQVTSVTMKAQNAWHE